LEIKYICDNILEENQSSKVHLAGEGARGEKHMGNDVIQTPAASKEKKNDDKPWRFKPGNKMSKGRPKGGRVKLSERFLTTLAQDFDKHGASVIQYVRQNEPSTYLRVVASIVPKEALLKMEVSGEVAIRTHAEEVLNAYRLLGENVEDAEVIDD
jgi:hypothetical protein